MIRVVNQSASSRLVLAFLAMCGSLSNDLSLAALEAIKISFSWGRFTQRVFACGYGIATLKYASQRSFALL